MTRKAYKGFVLAMALLSLGIGVSWYMAHRSESADTYSTATVHRGDIENRITAVGILQPSLYVDVGAQVSGKLKSLKASAGDAVKEGQLLAEIDPRILGAKVAEAKATLDNLKAQLKIRQAQWILHTKEHARNLVLLGQDAVALSEVETSEASLATAKAEIEALKAQIRQAEAALETARTNLEYTRITAPMSGTVLTVFAKEGQTLNASQQTPLILRIADLDVMTVWAQVSEADVTRLKIGQEAYFTLLGQPDRKWTGAIRQILPMPQNVNNVVFYHVLFDVHNPEHALFTQMTAQVFIVLEKTNNALLAPVSALRTDIHPGTGDHGKDNGASYHAKVLRTDGTVEARPVTVGVINGISAQIISGLNESERVVTGMGTRSGNGSKGKGLGGGKNRGKL